MKWIPLASLALLPTFAATTAPAQTPSGSPTYLNFRIQQVKPDQQTQWESLRKEMSQRMQRNNAPFYHVYQLVVGPANVFLIVTPAGPIGEPATPMEAETMEPMARSWFDASLATLVSQTLLTVQVYPDLATRQAGSQQPGEAFVHVRVRTAAAGRGADFESWLRNDLTPALREAQAGDVRHARVVLGDSPRTWMTFSYVKGWPEAEVRVNPSVLAKGDPLIASQTDYLYRYREDLSFTAR